MVCGAESFARMVCTIVFIAPLIFLGVLLLSVGIVTLPSTYILKDTYNDYPNTFNELNFVYRVGSSFGYIAIIMCVLYIVFWMFTLYPGGGVFVIWYCVVPLIGAVVFCVIGSMVIHKDKSIGVYKESNSNYTFYEEELAQYEINEICCFDEDRTLSRVCSVDPYLYPESCDKSLKKIHSHVKTVGAMTICGVLGSLLISIGSAVGSVLSIWLKYDIN
ncbi:hypothetical protein EIN_162520 [Entamoeba invadens IP1]|uniref:Uncharacterized protein n=1 Tax=Entamoeba invadens IP1 TaxID=370355 RepID=A0A0A1TYR1_ENTIV|nr:hypothetical protein EIN_162520 [Entamoeba invadens IP1]ELP86608.1 hypothetical protein EIN_162520 [Entamoeba invadens IP1]|eukprot:XP_004185954.1 hypothetical protein EIN_162520 [Entamoeba invadens IP1]